MNRFACSFILSLLCLTLQACTSANYALWEKLGYEKRDILISRVEKARNAQEDAKKQFQTTMERFKALTGFQGGQLETQYNQVKADYHDCQDRAQAVRDRIASVDSVAQDMFKEWAAEIKQYKDPTLARDSQSKLRQTRARYDQMFVAMQTSESKMQPILDKFNDRVLYLKHNLNAAAITSLQSETIRIDQEVTRLIVEMETSIKEANSFIDKIRMDEKP